MYDFTNHPIWANNGITTQPGFVNSGWTCGGVNPDHMNWWFNRTDNALLDLNTRVETNTNSIDALTVIVNNISSTAEKSGLLGVYVYDPVKLISTSSNTYKTLMTFDHTVQASGDVHVEVAAEFLPQISPTPTSSQHCNATAQLFANNIAVISSQYGHTHAAPANRIGNIYGQQILSRHLNADYSYTAAFPVFTQGDNIQLKLNGRMNPSTTGTFILYFVKLVVREYRAFST